MARADLHADILAAAFDLSAFGELCLLANGAPVLGVVEVPVISRELRGQGTRTGGRIGVPHQVQPTVLLRDVDAAAVREQDALTIRGTVYLVVALAPDGQGMTQIHLMLPGAEDGPRPELRQWR